ncbi:hypothetical protein [Streptomyces melanogenes]|uniref:hypothetical protein n=1 Tax=Streptomyces melanogenes TaxID=67326 RepID=UPI0037A14410
MAKTLGGVFTLIAGAGTALGFSQEKLLAAINNDRLRFFFVAVLGLIAVGLSIWSLFQGANKAGNRRQSWILAGGVCVYLTALFLAITGVANYATGSGRPNIANLSVVPGSPVKINLTVKADGVPNKHAIIVKVQGFGRDGTAVDGKLYHAVLRPDSNGDVEQKLEVVWEAGDATRLTILVDQDGTKEINATCGPDMGTDDKLACSSIALPASKK